MWPSRAKREIPTGSSGIYGAQLDRVGATRGGANSVSPDWYPVPDPLIVEHIPPWMCRQVPRRDPDTGIGKVDRAYAWCIEWTRALALGWLLLTYRWWWFLVLTGTACAFLAISGAGAVLLSGLGTAVGATAGIFHSDPNTCTIR